jgi:hypothetical protein
LAEVATFSTVFSTVVEILGKKPKHVPARSTDPERSRL